jgi:23S rRNA (adenine2503-C2)-methyltransferase
MNLKQIKSFLESHQEPSFRFNQIKKNYYSGRFKSFEEMTDISKNLRSELEQNFSLLSVKPVKILSDDNSQKALLELSDNQKIESVLMDYDGWLTVCVSSQVGCPLNCLFCATGKNGLKRNLTAEEIVDQIIFWNQQIFPRYVGRIVFMGMGEPFLNWDNLMESLNIINSKDGLNIGARKISISTAGIVPKIIEFANLNLQINLAISLHAADQKTRESIMPITKQYSLEELKKACLYYVSKTGRQLFFEYALMDGINDSQTDILRLINFITSSRLFYLNIIPLNYVEGGAKPSKNFDKIVEFLGKSLHDFSVRRSFGQNFSAACGQLAGQ